MENHSIRLRAATTVRCARAAARAHRLQQRNGAGQNRAGLPQMAPKRVFYLSSALKTCLFPLRGIYHLEIIESGLDSLSSTRN